MNQSSVKRREFIGGSMGVITGSSFIHVNLSKIKNDVLRYLGLSPSYDSINITVFQTDRLADFNENYRGEMHSLKLSKIYLERELKKLSDKSDFSVNVHISDKYIPINSIISEDKEETLDNWRDYFSNNIKDSEKSRDSNILLTKRSNDNISTRGFGEYPCGCRDRSTVGITFNAGKMAYLTQSRIKESSERSFMERSLTTLIHEVGHNIGFTHDMGYAWHDEESNTIKVTPMMSDYYRNEYRGKTNKYGDTIVDRKEVNTPFVDYTLRLNSKITHTDVQY